MNDPDLSRFVDAWPDDFGRALGEIAAGRKRSHWMWYVFPQVPGLGTSPMAQRYAIASLAEAEEFLRHPVLGPGYRRLVDAVWEQVVGCQASIHTMFGSPDDAKLVSSLTLFTAVARRLPPSAEMSTFAERADAVLAEARSQGLPRCAVTERFLAG